ncbi:MAG: hypothetical protein ACI9R3_001471 [Verrucomicrobiales bacterium]|jgi:hypothetical protein
MSKITTKLHQSDIETNDLAEPQIGTTEASFWDESQIQGIIRHAGHTGRSPQEFFTKKWKEKLIHKRDSVGEMPVSKD